MELIRGHAMLVALLVVAGATPLFPTAAAQGCGIPAGEKPVVHDLTLGCDVRLVHKTLYVTGNLTVAGKMELLDSAIQFNATQFLAKLTVTSTGRLQLNGSHVAPGPNGRYEVLLAGRIAGANGTTEPTGEVRSPDRVHLETAPGAVALRNVTVRAPANGVVLDGGSATIQDTRIVDAPVKGLAVRSATLFLQGSVVQNNSVGAMIGEGGKLEDFVGRWYNRNTNASLTHATARLNLNGSIEDDADFGRLQPSAFETAAGARVERRAWVRVHVQRDSGAHLPVPGARVEFRDPDNVVVAEQVAGADGNIEIVMLPDWSKTGTVLKEQPQPFRLVGRSDHNFNSSQFRTDGSNPDLVLQLPSTPDTQRPAWAPDVAAPILEAAAGGFTTTGAVRLTWKAATDGPEPHAISHYNVYDTPEGAFLAKIGQVAGIAYDAKVTPAGNHTFRVAPVDLVGNEGLHSNAVTVLFDPVQPSVVWKLYDPATNKAGVKLDGVASAKTLWFHTDVNLTAKASDVGSLLKTFTHLVAGPLANQVEEPHVGNLTLTEAGTYKLTLRARDHAGNQNTTVVDFGIDRDLPTLALKVAPVRPDGSEGWYRSAPYVNVTASDAASGLDKTTWRTNETHEWKAIRDGSFRIMDSGAFLVHVQASDKAANLRDEWVSLKVDRVPPVVRVLNGDDPFTGWIQEPLDVEVEANDSASGVRRVQFSQDGGPWTEYAGPVRVDSEGATKLFVRAFDRAGNEAPTQEFEIRVDASPPSAGRLAVRPDGPGRLLFDWSADPPRDGESGIAKVALERRAAGTTTATVVGEVTDPAKTTFRQTNVAAGELEYRLVVTDLAGNEAAGTWIPVTVESTAQTGPDAGALDVVEGGVRLRLQNTSVLSQNIQYVIFLVDGEQVGIDETAPYEMVYETRRAADGTHQYTVVVRLEEGTYEESGSFVVDNDRPLSYGHAIALTIGLAVLGAGNGAAWWLRRRLARQLGGAV